MKLLNGSELAGFIKERQAKQVRALRQAYSVIPMLAVVVTTDHAVTETYLRLKQGYGADILVEVPIFRIAQKEAARTIEQLNQDRAIHGIILQLPLEQPEQTEELCDIVAPYKDVDGLGKESLFEPATPLAIRWLLSGYNQELLGKKILIIGKGKLVGAPLEKMLQAEGCDVQTADITTPNLASLTIEAEVIITAAGQPGLVKSEMIKEGVVVVDAGTASEGGKIVGDLDPAVYERTDLTLTPVKGGVGPLTICALFDNTIRAAAKNV